VLSGPAWLALEVKRLEPARAFYESTLDLSVRAETAEELRLAAGDATLVLRPPGPVPRGGLHTHFAFSIPPASYDDWWDRLDDRFALEEHRFGDSRSLYLYDPDGNCVELGQDPDAATPDGAIAGIFEVVLEVESLDRAVAFYEAMGFAVVDRGSDRRRVRLTAGELDLELWEPHLGLADARGGVHVDLGLWAGDPAAVASRLESDALCVASEGDARRIRDPDGHWITVWPADERSP
jgi:catechol-2,3-dioxygenase